MSVIASQWFGAFALAGAACWFDVRTRRIPNWLTFPAAALGLVAATLAHGGHGTVSSAAGFLVGLALFFPLFVLKGLGAGDVKLMGALGAWLGTSVIFGVAFYTTLAGGVLALALIVQARLRAPGGAQPLAAADALARLRHQAARLTDARDLCGSEASLCAADCDRCGADVLVMVKQLLRRRFRSERGAELIELALVLPILLLVFAGIVDFALMFQRYPHGQQRRARGRAHRRAARLHADRRAEPRHAVRPRRHRRQHRVADRRAHAGVSIDPPGATPAFPAAQVTVTMTHTYLFLGPVSGMLGGGSCSSITLSARSTMRIES